MDRQGDHPGDPKTTRPSLGAAIRDSYRHSFQGPEVSLSAQWAKCRWVLLRVPAHLLVPKFLSSAETGSCCCSAPGGGMRDSLLPQGLCQPMNLGFYARFSKHSCPSSHGSPALPRGRGLSRVGDSFLFCPELQWVIVCPWLRGWTALLSVA